MLTKIASLFGLRAMMTKGPRVTRSRAANRVRLGIEPLESRDAPSYLSFGTAYVAGAVSAANGTSAASYYLPNGNVYRDLASRPTSSVGESSSHLSYSNIYDTVRLELTSSVNTGNYTSGNARTNTTQYNN